MSPAKPSRDSPSPDGGRSSAPQPSPPREEFRHRLPAASRAVAEARLKRSAGLRSAVCAGVQHRPAPGRLAPGQLPLGRGQRGTRRARRGQGAQGR